MIDIMLFAILIILSVVDIIWKKFPSGFVTGLVLMTGIVAFINRGDIAIIYGLFSFIAAWMMLEFGVPINGVADLKVITMIGFLLTDLRFYFLFIVLIMLYGFVYQFVALRILKIKADKEIAFIPVLTICYATLYIIGGVM